MSVPAAIKATDHATVVKAARTTRMPSPAPTGFSIQLVPAAAVRPKEMPTVLIRTWPNGRRADSSLRERPAGVSLEVDPGAALMRETPRHRCG